MVVQFGINRVFPEQKLDGISAPVVKASAGVPPEANCVIDGVYIGDFQLALQVLRIDDHMGVTHVLSLVSSSILSSMCKSCVCPPTSIVPSNEKPDRYQGATISAHFQTAKRGSPLLQMVVPLMDTPEEDILQVLQPCFEFIDEGRRHGTVLVHCMAGRSRSATIVIAYLMRTLRLSMKQAMETLNRNYKKASPNEGYMRQLELFEKQLQKAPEGRCDCMSVSNPG